MRKLMKDKDNLISFQLTETSDKLPSLNYYNFQFKLEERQCVILEAINNHLSTVFCAPTPQPSHLHL